MKVEGAFRSERRRAVSGWALCLGFTIITTCCGQSALASIFTVVNSADSGIGSLRNALAVITTGDIITFQVPSISLYSALWINTDSINITGPVTITGGPNSGDLIFLQGKDILIRGVSFSNINSNTTNLLNILGDRAVIQNCTFSLGVGSPQGHILIGGPVDALLVGNLFWFLIFLHHL